jgi:Protein of unknown function, DUF547
MILSFLKLFVLASSLNFQLPETEGSAIDSDPNDVYYNQLDSLLMSHVDLNGRVDYKKLSKNPDLESIQKKMFGLFPDKTWPREQQTTFWINVYNVTVLKMVCDHYPVKSIMDIEYAFDLLSVKLGEKKYSLNQVEKIFLHKMNDPRIHFAINCGAVSCPPLMNKAYRASTLNSVIRERAKAFINDPTQNTISATEMQLSKIFEWYYDDFTANNTSTSSFINQYSKVQVNQGVRATYKEYDWSLNKK